MPQLCSIQWQGLDSVSCCGALYFLQGDVLLITRKVVVRGQEEHAVTLLAFAHRDTRAIPKALRSLRSLVVVVPAWAQRRPQLVLILCQSLNDDCRDRLVHAEISVRPLCILLREFPHRLQILGLCGGRTFRGLRDYAEILSASSACCRCPTAEKPRAGDIAGRCSPHVPERRNWVYTITWKSRLSITVF